jgi:hypothetical protein
MTFANLPTKYASDVKVVACCLAIRQREFIVFDSLQTKKIMGQPTNTFFVCVDAP